MSLVSRPVVRGFLALGLLMSVPLWAEGAASPFHPGSFQIGFAGLSTNGTVNGIYGPYIAFSPLFDFGKVGLRLEASTSYLHTSPSDSFQSLGVAAYLRFPFVSYFTTQNNNSSVTVSLRGVSIELGGGEETWWSRSDGWQPELTANFVISFHWYLERLTIGYTALYLPSGQVAIIRAGVGFSLF